MQENTNNPNQDINKPVQDQGSQQPSINQPSSNNSSPTTTQATTIPSIITTSPTTPPPPLPPSESKTKKSSLPVYTLALIMLLMGTGIGLLLMKELPQFNSSNKTTPATTIVKSNSEPLTVPKDAVQIETCEDNKGTLFVKPQDIPQGPIYMSYKGKVIGIEFMLNLNQIMNAGKFDFLSAQNVQINHLKFGYLSEGHEGNPVPHFHADLYTVPKSVEEAIKCPPGQSQQMNMPGMDMTPGSGSAQMSPIPSTVQMLVKPSTAMQQMQMSTVSPTITKK